MDRIIIIKHPEKIKELETEGARISWDELTCVGYPVSDDATEKLCQDIEKFRKKAGIEDSFIEEYIPLPGQYEINEYRIIDLANAQDIWEDKILPLTAKEHDILLDCYRTKLRYI